MTASNANIFTGPTGTLPVVNAQGQLYEEVQVATAGQTVFTLATFAYTPGTRSIFVVKNGLELRRAVAYTETDTTHVTLAAGATVGDVIIFKAFAVSQTLAPLQNNGVIPAGASGQVLAKSSGSDYALQWLNLSSIATLLDQPVQAVASAPTVDVTPYAATTRNLLITGTTQIDGWAITAGQVFLVKFAASLSLSNNVSQVTPTGAAIKVGPNDSCLVRATANNIVEILAFSKSTAVIPPYYNDHRLTLQSGNPVTSADVVGASTIYYTAYRGNNISLFNGTAWVIRQFTEISLALVGLINSRPYDIFCYDNNGTATLELAVWASDNARTVNLTRQDGVLVKSGDATRKYIGTLYTTSTTTIEDSNANRYLWNTYNRVTRAMYKPGNAGSWTYSVTGVYRQANGSGTNQVNVITGLTEDTYNITVSTSANNGTAADGYVAIGINSTTTAIASRYVLVSSSLSLPTNCVANLTLSGGRNQINWLEKVNGGSITFYGGADGYIVGNCLA